MSNLCGTSSLFTIEQIELIRRLRNSGITKEQVIEAFDSLSRLDAELGSLYVIPQNVVPPQNLRNLVPPACQIATPSSTTEVKLRGRRRWNESFDNEDPADEEMSNAAPGSDEDFQHRLEEFLKLTASRRLERINNLVAVEKMPVSNIAAKTGLSVNLIRRFLQGETTDISTNQKRSIYMWYAQHTISTGSCVYAFPKPASSGAKRLKVMQLVPDQKPSVRVVAEGSPDDKTSEFAINLMMHDLHTPRRERFTFREQHLEVLEEAFKNKVYPTSDDRQKIANKCNMIVKALYKRPLCEREMVSGIHVFNWFNNRRKELKRQSRDETHHSQEGSPVLATQLTSNSSKDRSGSPASWGKDDHDSNDSTSPQLDSAVINKLLYDGQEIRVKQEPKDEPV